MKYLVIQKQLAQGCDYTIGCGMRYDIMEAENVNDLVDKIVYPDGKDEWSIFYHDESAIDELIIVNFSNAFFVNVEKIKEKTLLFQKQEESLELEKREREELAKLKNKYE